MKAEFLICGGGIVGLTIARELVKRGFKDIVILEKEDDLGRHASGRNSGVLHAGIYYPKESLKARFCLRGNRLMKEYCRENNLLCLETGKVVVAREEGEIKALKALYHTALQNMAKVRLVDEKELKEIEPYAKTCGLALYSPNTAVVDPDSIIDSIYTDLVNSKKVKVLTGTRFYGLKGSAVAFTNRGEIGFSTFINAAGAHSDRVAHSFGVGLNYRLLPFKGGYRRLRQEKSHLVRGNIYPLPDLKTPFLGVHLTKDVRGDVFIGPTVSPAFGREHYGLIDGMDIEAPSIFLREMMLFCKDPKFRAIAIDEVKKRRANYFFERADELVDGIDSGDILPSNKVGIRAQLVDWDKKEMVMDFKVIKDGDSIHVLNAISPAFTSSMGFAEFVVDRYIIERHKGFDKAC